MTHSVKRNAILVALALGAVLWLNACSACTSSDVAGTYADSSGTFKLELKSGGTASLTTMSDTTACTYKVDGKQLNVQCENQTLPFTIQDDGSLQPPAGSAIGPLKKAKN